MKIVLLGYMASGKSAIGKVLAERMDVAFVDLDTYIEKMEHASISDIFKNKGEIYFRNKEGIHLQDLLNSKENCIISVGGGTPCYGNNMDFILTKATSFYLNASSHTLFERLKNETSKRPLVATVGLDNLEEYIAIHLFERTEYYNRAANTVFVNDKSIPEIVAEIKKLL